MEDKHLIGLCVTSEMEMTACRKSNPRVSEAKEPERYLVVKQVT